MSWHVLGIDPGSKCGFALCGPDGVEWADSKLLGPVDDPNTRIRTYRTVLHDYLTDPIRFDGRICFEKSNAHKAIKAAQLHGAFWGVTEAVVGDLLGTDVLYVAPASVKKFATGDGHADKRAVLAAAREAWPNVRFEDDNAADAAWIAYYGYVYLLRQSVVE